MGGYIGATAVGLTTTAADVQGDITSTDTTPELILKNTTETDADGSRDGKITFKGEQSGGEESTLAQIQSSHDGTADDQKGDLIFKTNDGSDGASPTEAMRINSDQNISIPDNGKVMFGTGDDLQIYHDATNSHISNATGDLTLDVAGDLIIDVDGGDVKFKDDGTEFSQYYKDGNDLAIYSSISDGDIKFQGKDGSSVITALTLDMSEGGYVGIGLTAPTAPLTVKSPSNAEAIHVVGRSDDIGQMKFFEADHTTILSTLEARNSFVNFGSVANIPLQFMTNNTERMRITSAGALHLGGSDYNSAGLSVGSSTDGVYSYRATSNGSYGLHHFTSDVGGANTLKAYVDTSGNFSTVSDYRIKENVTEISDGISKVKQLRPVSYNQIGSDKAEDGFIAHELQEVLPNLVTGDKDELKDDGSPFIQAVNYQGLSATLVSALQEAIAKIETLETKVAALEG